MRLGAFPYQKIFIATAGVSELSQEDLRVITKELRWRERRATKRSPTSSECCLRWIDHYSSVPPFTTPANGSPGDALQCLADDGQRR
jgi:hypothetical protein